MLAVCGGYQLAGHRYIGQDGSEMPGVGLLDLETRAGDTRLIGDIVCECDLGDGVGSRTLVGFENHAGQTVLGAGCEPLARVISGHGNDGSSGYEGARAGAVLGTYVHGPLLPKNPWLADWLIERALERRYRHVELEPLDDQLELAAATAAAERRSSSRSGSTTARVSAEVTTGMTSISASPDQCRTHCWMSEASSHSITWKQR